MMGLAPKSAALMMGGLSEDYFALERGAPPSRALGLAKPGARSTRHVGRSY